MTAAVLVVGSLHYDIMVETPHLPRRDETAVGSRWYPKFGGKGGNQAVAARRQSVPARMAGAVGDDDFGRLLRAHLQSEGVDADFVSVIAETGSGISVALVDPAGDYAATIVSGANLQIDVAALAAPALWKDIGLLILQNEVPEAVNRAAATEARARGLPVLLNAAPFRPLPADLLANVTHLIVNAVEAEGLGTPPVTSLAAASAAARQLSPLAANVIVTAGAQGLAAASGQETVSVPAEDVRTVSSHGAGDAFIGALAAALLRGATLHVAAQTAARAAARHVAGLPAT
ncbi:MAG: bifunctional hydroxymethylpyrimidine kinase/phosphomethylpyrimidine kinase [Rhodobacter sp.]|nr:bifunctional hydroxymethylpyrimidine kinase/phosphomethylpyrimidine kinase [Rhodobacter sp.]